MILLDHNASTPLDPRVAAVMAEAMREAHRYGNPSSQHGLGRAARDLLERARLRIAGALGCEPLEVTFTSGGTEADTLAVLGIVRALRSQGRPHAVLSSPLEHPAITAALTRLAAEGVRVHWVLPDGHGRITAAAIERALAETCTARSGPGIGLVTLALCNHELGNVYDVPGLMAEARRLAPEVRTHTDAVQALGKLDVRFAALGVDAMSVSAHKIGGPIGIGALVHEKSLAIEALFGGTQERGRRGGSEALWSIVGFAEAVELAVRERAERMAVLGRLGERLRVGLGRLGARIHGDALRSSGTTVNFAFAGCPGELVCMNLDLEGFAASTGAACSAGTREPSAVVRALGLSPREAREAVRISLGPGNTEDDLDRLLALLPRVIDRVRAAEAGEDGSVLR